MKLRTSVPKHGDIGRHREFSSEQTFARVRPHLRRAGITRIADITGLDRIGIPVFNAVVPRSHDELSVYNGKGGSPIDAMTSAVMEAMERFCAWQPMRPDRIASFAELSAGTEPVLDPASHNMQPHPLYHAHQPLSWVRGFDLLNEQTVLVPLCLAGYYIRFHEQPCYKVTTTNGIASGNSLEEAICHALSEVVERDAWTMAELVCNRLRTVVATRVANAPPGSVQWLEDKHPALDLGTLPTAPARYAQMFADAGVHLVIRNVTSATGVPTFAALIREDLGPTVSAGHAGYGSHPDAEVAVMRALAEAAQSRAVDLQAVREDLNLPGAKVQKWQHQTYRSQEVDPSRWPYGEAGDPVRFGDVPSHPSDDVMADLGLLLERVRALGLPRVIAVDLSIADLPVHVARVIVPGMETYAMDQGKLGRRAGAMWDTTLRELIARRPEVAVR
ncbi:YcaO-like family protein [Rhizocola hellebori]|uniref:YcaO-like family protein n=1 Tax=Rhizocola hellebori TaxID=1392758 RepID=UPI001943BBC3|nr:YcaO-like family protein [Rhizocola hellebori]